MSTDLRKLTVPQLKALWKEKGITGYSKLAKNVLIDKLAAHGTNRAQAERDPIAHRPPQGNPPTQVKEKTKPQDFQIPTATLSVGTRDRQDVAQGPPFQAQTTVSVLPSIDHTRVSQTPKGKATEEAGEPQSKKQKLIHGLGQRKPRVQTTVQGTVPMMIQPSKRNKDRATAHIPRQMAVKSKRYIPLVIRPRDSGVSIAQQPSTASPSLPPLRERLEYLSFPLPEELNLSFGTITLPPSLSQRRYASKLAIILRDVRREDMRSLALTSRLFRYSGYLSAGAHLKRWFPGKRLERVLTGISIDRMNLWPYRVSREDECRRRKNILRESMLGRLVGGDVGIIAESVWKSGDDARQAVIAVRFLLTRCYFCVSLNQDLARVKRYRVTEVQEVVRGEIWRVVVETWDGGRPSSKFYVLEATCEVIGGPVAVEDQLPARGDWSGYIQRHISEYGATKKMDIMDHIRWVNHEEYDQGISKIWLKRTQEEGEFGKLKRVVARRYIIACTMENSLGGEYMTWKEMEQEFNGLSGQKGVYQKAREKRVNLFVPAQHHVESVEFTAASKGPLHPALAVIQTPSREYYVLKDNGMEVGCEEEGIGDVWMERTVVIGPAVATRNMILESGEYDLSKLFALIVELGESLNENRKSSVALYAQANNVKTQAIHSQSGFVLRRFNMDKAQEEYESELERMNAAIAAENQGLQHDNKQLSSLIKEYEQTLETVMSAFRNRARDVQERELSLIREYETELLSREEENATEELVASTAISASLARLSHILRKLLRAECGEDDEEPPETRTEEEEEEEPWNATLAAEHSMGREIELARLQAENEQLKQMLGLLPRRVSESRLEGDYLNLTREGKYVPYGRGSRGGQDG